MGATMKVEEVLKSFKRRLVGCKLVKWMGSYEEIFGIEEKMKWIVEGLYDFWLSCK